MKQLKQQKRDIEFERELDENEGGPSSEEFADLEKSFDEHKEESAKENVFLQ